MHPDPSSSGQTEPQPHVEREQPEAGRRLAWIEPSRRTVVLLLCQLVFLGGVLRLYQMHQAPPRTPDERTYTDDALRIVSGFDEFPAIVSEHHQNPSMWILPPPTRVGQITIVATMMKLTGIDTELAGAWWSCLASLVALGLVARIAYLFLPAWAAIYATAALAISLPALLVAFRCWPDAPLEFLAMLLVWASCELRGGPRRWWMYAVLVAAGSASVLVKESGAVIYLGCVLYVSAILFRERAWRELLSLAAAGLTGAAIALVCLSAAAGGMDSVFTVWRNWSQGLAVNTYGLEYQSGPWLRFFHAFWLLTPVNLVLAGVAAVIALLPKAQLERLSIPLSPQQQSYLRLFAWIALMLLLTVLLLPISQNFRYLSPMYGCMYLLGGMGLWAVLQWAGRFSRIVLVLVGATVLATGFRDYQLLRYAYRGFKLPDLAVKMVLDSTQTVAAPAKQ